MDRSPDPRAEPTACVFTTLFGAYERLNEQPKAHESSVPFIVVTDDDDLRSGTWTPRVVDPAFPADPIRSQREVKISPHEVLGDFDVSLYIDNTVLLSARPEEIIDRYLATDTALAVPAHSFRESVEDEFLEVARLGLDDNARIFEQLGHYDLTDPDVLDERPLWTGVLLRRHMDPRVQRFGRTWLGHVLRYSRRDQLSINAALRHADVEPTIVEIDNHSSWFHSWPHAPGRDRTRGHRDPRRSRGPRRSRERSLELDIGNRDAEIDRLTAENGRLRTELQSAHVRIAGLGAHIDGLRTSRSWRTASRLRSAATVVRSLRSRIARADGPAAPAMLAVPLAGGSTIHVNRDDPRGQALAGAGGVLNPPALAMWRALVAERPWDAVVDIGANYGEMIVDVPFPAGARVVAVEPDPVVARCLRRTLDETDRDVDLLTAAVASPAGGTALHVDTLRSGRSRLHRPGHESTATTPPSVTTTLSSIVTSLGLPPGAEILAKIDVEGDGLDVLRSHDGPLTALVEVLRMTDDDLEWIRTNCEIRVLDLADRVLDDVDTDSVAALHSLLDDPRHHAHDIVVRRR